MSDYPNETVQDAANKLMAALALHEDARGTVTDALHDMYDAGREHAATNNLATICEIANAAIVNPVGRLSALYRIRAAAGGTDADTPRRGEFSYTALLDAADIATDTDNPRGGVS